MSRMTPWTTLSVLLVLLVGFGQTARAQSDIRGEIIADLDEAAAKVAGLAEVLDDAQYAWAPAEGVRTSAQVLLHIAATNYLIPGFVGCTPPEGADAPKNWREETVFEDITDRARIHAQITDSFAFAKKCIGSVPDETLTAPITYFGTEGTGRSVLIMMVAHLHEHLGQLIAYARMNGVVPPWSR